MKIKTVQISNILSFKHYESMSECGKLDFGIQDDGDFHILIGPNGSGKSNFLEILNQVFKNILFPLFPGPYRKKMACSRIDPVRQYPAIRCK